MFPKMTPMYDQVRTLAAVNDLIFDPDAQAETVLTTMKSLDLDMDTLADQAYLIALWLKRFPNNKAWVKACARVVETHAVSHAEPGQSQRVRSILKWEWMDAVWHALPQGSANLRKVWSASTTVPFWLVYRKHVGAESLSSVTNDAWQDFAVGGVSTHIPRNVLMEVAAQCWTLPEFACCTAKRGLLAFLLYQRGCHLYHDRLKMVDLEVEPYDADSRRFLYWGYSSAAWDFDGKRVKLPTDLVLHLLTREGDAVLRVQEHAFFSGVSNPLASSDSDDLDYIREKLKAPWSVLRETIDIDQRSVEETMALCLPVLGDVLSREPMPTTNSAAWFEKLRSVLVS